jgi:hypothetical protein
MDWYKEFPQNAFLELIASGKTEPEALELINEGRGKKSFHPAVLVQLQVKRPEFREKVEEAKKVRADKWFNDIAASTAKVVDKEAVPAEKLKFEQRKYLAAIDNPEKYSEKVAHKLDVSINVFEEMKSLKGSDVQKILASADPFAISAEFEVVDEEEDIFE